MKYATAAAFRQAIEHGLAARLRGNNRAIGRSRKIIVIDRILARLLTTAPKRWILKGGTALDLRLGDRARMTQDLDLACRDTHDAALIDLLALTTTKLDDYFMFEIRREAKPLPNDVAVRHHIQATLAGKLFEAMTIDVASSADSYQAPDVLPGTDLLQFSGLPRLSIPTISIEQHLAEKLHAYTRIYEGGRTSSRVKDLVDVVLIQANLPVDARRLRDALAATFADRGAHPLPHALPLPPPAWVTPYRTLALDSHLDPDLQHGHQTAAGFLDPILDGSVAGGHWNPQKHHWAGMTM